MKVLNLIFVVIFFITVKTHAADLDLSAGVFTINKCESASALTVSLRYAQTIGEGGWQYELRPAVAVWKPEILGIRIPAGFDYKLYNNSKLQIQSLLNVVPAFYMYALPYSGFGLRRTRLFIEFAGGSGFRLSTKNSSFSLTLFAAAGPRYQIENKTTILGLSAAVQVGLVL